MNSPHCCLECGERPGSIKAPRPVVFMLALCNRTRSLKDVNFARPRRAFAKPPPGRLPGGPTRIESSGGSAGAPLIHHDTMRGLSADAVNFSLLFVSGPERK
jgi:hypothetical protein